MGNWLPVGFIWSANETPKNIEIYIIFWGEVHYLFTELQGKPMCLGIKTLSAMKNFIRLQHVVQAKYEKSAEITST